MSHKSQIVESLKRKDTVIIHGPIGTGKTHIIKSIIPRFKNKTFYLMCPLEKDEFKSYLDAVKNNPNTNLIVDNIEDADSSTVREISKFLTNKKKESLFVVICSNIYERHLKIIRDRFDSKVTFTQLKISDAVIFAESIGANKDIIDIIIKRRPTDYRQVLKIVEFKSDSSCLTKKEVTTFSGFKNSFNTFEWLLGVQSNANLYEIVNTDHYFYVDGIHKNYLQTISSLSKLVHFSDELSLIDSFEYLPLIRDNLLIRLRAINREFGNQRLHIILPQFRPTPSFRNPFPTKEHYYSLHHILNCANVAKPKKEILQRILELRNYYKLSNDIIEECLKNSFCNKKIKMRVNLKRTINNV
tara:strand:+ start:1495 stop:2565 length:1071 start_codon:yes stop_codon:yes gene_type:complete